MDRVKPSLVDNPAVPKGKGGKSEGHAALTGQAQNAGLSGRALSLRGATAQRAKSLPDQTEDPQTGRGLEIQIRDTQDSRNRKWKLDAKNTKNWRLGRMQGIANPRAGSWSSSTRSIAGVGRRLRTSEVRKFLRISSTWKCRYDQEIKFRLPTSLDSRTPACAFLLVSQRHHRIDPGRPAGREVTGRPGHAGEHRGNGCTGERVDGPDAAIWANCTRPEDELPDRILTGPEVCSGTEVLPMRTRRAISALLAPTR